MEKDPFRTGTILIVDDEPELTQSLSDVLSREGYEVVSASSGDSAYSMLDEFFSIYGSINITAIVSDWKMANGDGIQLLRQIRTNPNFTDIPFVLISGAVSREKLNEAILLDADAVLLKPFELSVLLEKVDFAIQQRQIKANRKIIGTKIF